MINNYNIDFLLKIELIGKEVFEMKKKLIFTYPAIITNENNSYWIKFIDLDGYMIEKKINM